MPVSGRPSSAHQQQHQQLLGRDLLCSPPPSPIAEDGSTHWQQGFAEVLGGCLCNVTLLLNGNGAKKCGNWEWLVAVGKDNKSRKQSESRPSICGNPAALPQMAWPRTTGPCITNQSATAIITSSIPVSPSSNNQSNQPTKSILSSPSPPLQTPNFPHSRVRQRRPFSPNDKHWKLKQHPPSLHPVPRME